uniref:E3 ubiquitin-protein ligase n=1 Tax=Denticeps clupeoides TaxID=299321 RepID=A0AAY4AT50_9TELE
MFFPSSSFSFQSREWVRRGVERTKLGDPRSSVMCSRWRQAPDCAAAILRHVVEQGPQIYCLAAEPKTQEEEQEVQQRILHPLEWFLFGEEPEAGLGKLQQGSGGSGSQLCGRVFKEGETVYSCRDCAIDPTCVLCMDCFQSSVHKGHRYKMHASSGGGFCDCGDVEAWKTGPCCSQHDPGASVAMETVRPSAVSNGFCWSFHVEFSTWNEDSELPAEVKDNTYYCVLYNDEHHSYEQVIHTLCRSINCTQTEAQAHTALIDREGRRAVKRGTLRSCQQTKELIKVSGHISLQPLRVEILHSVVMAHQSFAQRLGPWFQQIIGYSVGLRQIFCQVALEPSPDPNQTSLISRLMLHDARLYKGARKVVHELIFCSLLMETEYKRQFAIEFTKHYKQLQKDFISDDHERNISITAISVQIFTVPTLARQLIEEVNVIKVITDTVMEMLWEHLDANHRFHFQGYNSDKFFRVQVIFHDLRYILISKPTTWTEELRTQFLEGFSAFLGLLNCMQGMEEVKRQFGQHVEVEPEWEAGFSIQMQLRHILAMFQDWCSSDDKVLLQAFKECHRALMRCTNQPFRGEANDFYMCKHILHTRPYKVSQEPVSIHVPISRLLAGENLDFTYLVEHPLRCVVLAAQVSAEMWRRNGLSLVSQVYYYQDVKCRDEMYDKDVMMLQIAASKMDPDLFLILILLRFELFEIFNGSCSSKDKVRERYVPGISDVTREDVTMREVIHLLCIEPMAHSSLVKGLPENESHETGLETVIPKVATFRKPGVSGHGMYEVKKECLQEFNPFFYHYSKSQHSKVFNHTFTFYTPPPVPPPFCPLFSSIVHLLSCDVFIHILRRVLQRAVEDRNGLWTEAMIQRVGIWQDVYVSDTLMLMCTKLFWYFIFPLKSVQDKEKAERKRKAEAAKLHRQKIMAQMSAMQKNFIKTHKMLYENVPESAALSSPASDITVGAGVLEREVLTCILCQEEQEVQTRGLAMVLTACVQRSTVLTQSRGKTLSTEDPLFMPPDLAVGTHTGSCGHVMHAPCWQKYFEAVQNTTRNRLHTELIIDLENGEYMCPLCKSLCNTVVPLIPLEPAAINYAELVGELLTLPRWIQIILARVKGLRSKADVDALCVISFSPLRPKYSSSIAEMLVVCATTVHRVGLQVAPNEQCPQVPVMAWNTCAYTIQATENMLEEEQKPLFGSLQNRQLAGLKAVVQFSAAQRHRSSQAVVQKHFAGMLAVLLPVPTVEDTPSILEIDFFHLLVGLVLSIPALYQEKAVDLQPSAISTAYNHLHLLHLVTVGHMVQILLSLQGHMFDVFEFVSAVDQNSLVSYISLRTAISGSTLAESVRRGMLPFLRCAALFFNCLTAVAPPEELSSTAGSHMEALCSYLALPSNIFQLFQDHQDTFAPLLQRYKELYKHIYYITVLRYPRKRNRLIDLPEDYSVLLNQASHFKCPKSSDEERKHPTLCLVCGTMLCSQSTCCQKKLEGQEVGACTAHAATCGAGVGVFLRVRECEIVLMASKTRGSTYPAPYLDDYGETDPQLGRGNPLHLCPERYRKLHQLWQQHCVLEEIARSLEVLNVMFAFDWQML